MQQCKKTLKKYPKTKQKARIKVLFLCLHLQQLQKTYLSTPRTQKHHTQKQKKK